MESFFRRRRRLLVGVAAGAAGALAAFYWYTGYAKNKLEQQRSVEAELTAILRGESQSGAAGGDDGEEGEGGEEGDECGSPDLDESLDSHFNYIQKVSAPQELTNLLPRVQETLFRQQLRLLARLCFGRTLAAVFLLPLMDLCVRTKLNVIAWLVEQAMAAAEVVLDGTALDAQVTPEELAALVQEMASRMGQAVTAASATSATGSAWVDILYVLHTAIRRRALASAAMVEELTTELRRVLCNYRFGEALHAAVGQCLSTCAAHIHATFISQAAAAATQPQPARPQPAPAVSPSAPSAPLAAAPKAQVLQPTAPLAEPEPEPPKQAVVSPFSAVASGAESASATEVASPGGTGGAGGAVPAGAPVGSPLEAKTAPPIPEGEAASEAETEARSGACDPLFVDAREVTARIACLQPVMSLCAVAFAAPLEL
eukprot:XP_001689835.1 predicted protein [Chlamydomonas reinhardtii]